MQVIITLYTFMLSAIELMASHQSFNAEPQAGNFKWSIEMPPPPEFLPGSSFKCVLTIQAAASVTAAATVVKHGPASHKKLKFSFGEVWYCAGQSNMNWPMSKLKDSGPAIKKGLFASFSMSYLSLRLYQCYLMFLKDLCSLFILVFKTEVARSKKNQPIYFLKY